EILGVVSSIRSRYAPPAIDAVDTFYGHPNIEVAIQKPLDNTTYDPDYTRYGGWVQTLSQKWPEDIKDGSNTTDPVLLYRKLLASADDNSVTIAVIGFFDVLYRLVDSPADSISGLTGWELIKKKVVELVVQADASAPRSYNLSHHNVTFAAHVLNSWPKMLTFVPGYVGRNIRMGAKLATALSPDTNPVAFVWNATIGAGNDDGSWDPAAIYYAIRGLDDVYHYNKTGGAVTILPNGTSTWDDSAVPAGKQNWVDLTMSNVTFAKRLEDILLWEPSKPKPTNLIKCGAAAGNGTTTGTGSGSAGNATTARSVTPSLSAVFEDAAPRMGVERSVFLGAAMMLAAIFAL
ncbi:hypothetical protein DFP73DRAFT_480552, partial [Morchella snyderi]